MEKKKHSRQEWAQQIAFGIRDGVTLSPDDCQELFDILTTARTEVATSSEMLRCLGFALDKREVTSWPIWCCSMPTVKEAVSKGWLSDSDRAPMVPRLGLSHVVYKLTAQGSEEFCRLSYTVSPPLYTEPK